MNTSFWSSNGLPGASHAVVINNGGTAALSSGTPVSISSFRLGENTGNSGYIQISGNNTRLNVSSPSSVGINGIGGLHVTNGAQLTTTSLNVSSGSMSNKPEGVHISGAGTQWNSGDLRVGVVNHSIPNEGITDRGMVYIYDHAVMTSTGTTWLACGSEGGQINLYQGARWNAADIRIGDGSYGILNIYEGGTLTANTIYVGNGGTAGGNLGADGAGSRVSASSIVLKNSDLYVQNGAEMVVSGSLTVAAGTPSDRMTVSEATLRVGGAISTGSNSFYMHIQGVNAEVSASSVNSSGLLYLDFVGLGDRVPMLHVTNTATLPNTQIEFFNGNYFQVMKKDHVDLIEAATIIGTPTLVLNQSSFTTLDAVNIRENNRDIVRLAFAADTLTWNLDNQSTFMLPEDYFTRGGNSRTRASIRVEGTESTDLLLFFKNIGSLEFAQTLVDLLNDGSDPGLRFSVFDSNTLRLSGNYLNDDGYAYIGWVLGGIGKAELTGGRDVILLGFQAVPEPATWGMMLLSLAGLMWMTRKKYAAFFNRPAP